VPSPPPHNRHPLVSLVYSIDSSPPSTPATYDYAGAICVSCRKYA